MTGRYAHKIGFQHMQVIGNDEPKYVPRKFKMIPAKLREQGYKTHMLGKYV